MSDFIEKYHNNVLSLLNSIRVTDKEGKSLNYLEGIEKVCRLIKKKTDLKNKLIFIGNGASAAISSHMATDFWKNGGMKAIAFNDSSLLTCISNDYGYEHVFEKPIEMFANKGDILVAISSSGKSENILLGVHAARSKGCKAITLSGFEPDNPLSSSGDLNFYVSSKSYGPVETIHQYVCHLILDVITNMK